MPQAANPKNDKRTHGRNSIHTMGQTDLLEDLVGMVGGDLGAMGGMAVLGGDADDDLEIGSDYPYANELQTANVRGDGRYGANVPDAGGRVPSTNTTSYEFKNRIDNPKHLDEVELFAMDQKAREHMGHIDLMSQGKQSAQYRRGQDQTSVGNQYVTFNAQ